MTVAQLTIQTAQPKTADPLRSLGPRAGLEPRQSPGRHQETPPLVREVLVSGGRPLDLKTRSWMESRFGADFSGVRIHDGGKAAESARALKARAYTVGSHIVFGSGQLSPESRRGRWLLAHELAHVAQTRAGTGASGEHAVEADASRAATAALSGHRPHLAQHHDGTRIYRFGEPENVPDVTYISTQGAQRFLNEAVAYHQAWGLSPVRITSVEALVDDLARGTSRLGRIRIVLHAAEIGIYSSLFTGEPRLSLQAARLEAYAQSDIAGLTHDIGTWVNMTPSLINAILTHLRSAHPGMLTPFGIETSGTPTGTLATMFQRATELYALTRARTPANASQADPIIAGLNTLLADLRQRLQTEANITAAQAQALQTAIQDAVAASGWTFSFTFSGTQSQQVAQASRAIGAGFRDKLNRARQRFDRDSWIDIRGCNVGTNSDYLRAVSRFFGRADALPHVSGPDWYQVFPRLVAETLRNDAAIDALAGDANVQIALNRWSVITGARTQLAFLRSFYQLEIMRRQAAARAAAPGPPTLGSGLLLQVPAWPVLLPPLSGGLPTPAADQVVMDLLQLPPRLELAEPGLFRQRPSLSLGMPRWDPMIQLAQDALDRLNGPNAELRYYFHAGLVLPVYQGPSQQAFRLYMLHSLREQAMDNWLDSQWSTAAPGLAALKARAWNFGDARRVTALVETHEEDAPAGAEMVFPPDPRYWQHIRRI